MNYYHSLCKATEAMASAEPKQQATATATRMHHLNKKKQ